MNNSIQMTGIKPPVSNIDAIKRLIRSAGELVKKIDLAMGKIQQCQDLFTPELVEMRNQVLYLCSKALLTDPQQCRRKAEELMWRKCYYEVVSIAKSLSKKCPLSFCDKFYIENHLDSGIAKLSQHLKEVCLELQQHGIPCSQVMHFNPLSIHDSAQAHFHESKEDLVDSAQRILVWLGDLSRYRIDLGLSSAVLNAQSFYQQATLIDPSNGLPFNQLGTLVSINENQQIEAMFYYLRSIAAPKSFAGAESNLLRLIDRLLMSKTSIVATFSQLVKKLVTNIKDEDTLEIGKFCESVLGLVQKQLDSEEEEKENGENLRNSNLLFEMTSVILMCTLKSTAKTANQRTAAVAFTCSLLSHVLSKFHRVLKLGVDSSDKKTEGTEQEKSPELDEEEEQEEDEEELRRAKMRRRKLPADSNENSDSSDSEFILDFDSNESEEELEILEDDKSEVGDSGFNSTVAKTDIIQELPTQLCDLLVVVEVLFRWLQCNPDVIQASGKSARNMWIIASDVLNYIRHCKLEDPAPFTAFPLPEDWKFFGLSDFNKNCSFNFESPLAALSDSARISTRIERILRSGEWIAEQAPESGLKLENGSYFCEGNSNQLDNSAQKKGLMRNMAQLWLRSEVQELERKLKPGSRRQKKNGADWFQLPYVYIVPDVSALSEYHYLLKQVVKAKRFIIVVPSVVISELDELKKEKASVRDSIRWLEQSFRTGNRFVRAQRQSEHTTIPLLTYPKRKDKANWTMFQILECCHYLDIQQRKMYKNNENSPVVLLLTGMPKGDGDVQIKGVCQSIGVDLKCADALNGKKKFGKFRS